MSPKRKLVIMSLFLVLAVSLAGCDSFEIMAPKETGITASGVVEAKEVAVSSEIAGRVAEVFVEKGAAVAAGEPLFRVESELLHAEHRRAAEALEMARLNREVAQDQLEAAQLAIAQAEAAQQVTDLQYQMVLDSARLADQPNRQAAWGLANPDEFDTPVWYFEKIEQIGAARAGLEAAAQTLAEEKEDFETLRAELVSADLIAAEDALAEAQANFRIVEELQDRDLDRENEIKVQDYIDDLFNTAEAELERAQNKYEAILTEEASDELLEARSRVAVAQERYEIARDNLTMLLTGEQAVQVEAAGATREQSEMNIALAHQNLAQAETGVRQADQAIALAEADMGLIETQLEKLVTLAPTPGTVLARLIEPGEIVQPGMIAMTLARLEDLTVTVYVSEDRYGQIDLGDHAQVSSDSFPGQIFDAEVVGIADKAEFTPRNVQTEEDRQTTVFAIELSFVDGEGKLKPGMPVTVAFEP